MSGRKINESDFLKVLTEGQREIQRQTERETNRERQKERSGREGCYLPTNIHQVERREGKRKREGELPTY